MKIRFVLTMLFGASLASPIRAEEPRGPLPADLAAVPVDALGFVHIRVADIWKSDLLKDFRETVLKAGAKALEGFDARFLPAPSSIDRLTIVMVAKDPELRQEPDFLAILAVNKPFDRAALLKSALPKAVEHKTANGSFFADEKSNLAVFFVANQVLVVGPAPAIKRYVDQRSKPITDIVDALDAANTKRHITAVANMSLLPAQELVEAPRELRPLLFAKFAVVSLDLAENAQIDISLQFRNERSLAVAEQSLQNLAARGRIEIQKSRDEMLRKVLGGGKTAPLEDFPDAVLAVVALGSFERLDEILANPPIKRDGNSLHASLKMPSGSGLMGLTAMGVGVIPPALQKIRSATTRNNLLQIALAMHNYHDTYGTLPTAAICDKNGKPLLSWRIAILPFIEQGNLYNSFKLDEPWDSPHNKKLIPQMPKIYLTPQAQDKEPGITHYRIFYGKNAVFDLKQSLSLIGITDGTSQTLLAFEAEEGVPWTKPEEFKYDPKKPLPKFASFFNGGGYAVAADGSVRFIRSKAREEALRAFITPNGGEVFDSDDLGP